MSDWLTREQRSRNMSSIRSKGNATTEGAFLKILRKNKITGWRRHPNLPGKPDFIFKDKRLAVFIDGCFWHGCLRCGHIPKTNRAYWRAKIARNKKRDLQTTRELRAQSYRVMRIWECHLRKRPDNCLKRILAASPR